jgi:hypothetical protein
MRMTALVVGLVLAISDSSAAQEWDLYTNIADGFNINFPGQPRITETTWVSQLDYKLPARIYSADKGDEHFSVTVVDYSGIEQMGRTARPATPTAAPTRARRSAPATHGMTSAAPWSMRPPSSSSATPS